MNNGQTLANCAGPKQDDNVPSLCISLVDKTRNQNARLKTILDTLVGPRPEKSDDSSPSVNSLIESLKYINDVSTTNNAIITLIERALGV